ncbi:MAG: dTDP-4-dehydrorhamnose reductase [Solirubrobacterales bacterium]
MKIVVTGAHGMLGRDLVVALEAVHHEVVGFDQEHFDITDYPAVLEAFERELPALVINCAAWTNVDGAEDHEEEANAVNAHGAGNVAAAAAAIGVRVIHISTDYVFDGTKREPYVESDEPNPINAYARTKYNGEIEVAEANPRHLIVRTAWLYGPHGKNFVETMLTIAESRREVLVVNDQFGCPTYTADLAGAIVDHLVDFERLGIMHITGGEYCSWYDFAREIFRQSQVDIQVLSSSTEMFGSPTPRPVFTALTSEREETPQLERWDHGLHRYLLRRAEAAGEASPSESQQEIN